MKNPFPIASSFLMIFTIGCLGYLALPQAAVGQENAVVTNNASVHPDSEKFTKVQELAVPWRDSFRGCDGVNSAIKLPDCPEVKQPEIDERTLLSIYNADGSIWNNIDVSFAHRGDFMKKGEKIDDFDPLAPKTEMDILFSTVILRMVGESDHWYEVEVNEKTQATKFILRSDPNWSKVGWGFIFGWSVNVELDSSRQKLRDKPNGSIIEEYANRGFGNVKYLKLDGDWMYIEAIHNVREFYYGWIRWRKGRDILVGSILNEYKAPKFSEEPVN